MRRADLHAGKNSNVNSHSIVEAAEVFVPIKKRMLATFLPLCDGLSSHIPITIPGVNTEIEYARHDCM